jgi:hypothetical protein
MSYLNIYNCGSVISKDNFQCNSNCEDIISAKVCEEQIGYCRIFNDECKDICRFTPKDASEENYDSFGMVSKNIDDEKIYYFEDEDTRGLFSECFAKCREVDGSLDKSFCSTDNCKNNCSEYVARRVSEEKKQDRRYTDYPDNRLEQEDYNKIKNNLIDRMQTGEFKDEIQNQIFQDRINSEITSQVNLEEETTKLNNIMTVLKNLNSSGNNFIQQVGQLGDFQDKYSQKIEELLEEKNQIDKTMDFRIANLNNKLESLNEIYKDFSTLVENNQVKYSEIKHYKSCTCLANGKSLNLMPVTYTSNDGRKYFRNGAYCIRLAKKSVQGTNLEGILYVEPKKIDPDDSTKEIYCNPNNMNCLYKLSIKAPTRDNPVPNTDSSLSTAEDVSEINLDDSINLTQNIYPEEGSNQNKFLMKKQAYFHIVQVKNNDEYNGILINTPNGRNNLITTQQIKYPFFLIESLELPGYVINVKKRSDGTGHKVTLEPAKGIGTEKFRASTEKYSDNDSAVCLTN